MQRFPSFYALGVVLRPPYRCTQGPTSGSFNLPVAEWEGERQLPDVTSTLRP